MGNMNFTVVNIKKIYYNKNYVINFERSFKMANDKKMVAAITDMEKDFPQWYTDVVKKADLADYSSVKGCMIIRPYGYAIWELIQKQLDQIFKDTGHENVYMPMFIPESLLQKEKDHIEGFAPEVAWVTQGGLNKLQERLVVRPTSETLFCDHYKNIIHSYRDLPKLYNQWCSVVRWEKTTRPFLRTTEFLWQEGHTAHATAKESADETIKMLNVYADFAENVLAMPVIKGEKTAKERFAGAKNTYTIESLMHDGKALQSGTSHNFDDIFAKAFGIQYTDKDNKLQYVHQTSWGVTTRLIGAIIMVHGDNSGLVLPPKIAPVQTIIVPIAMQKDGVVEKAKEIEERLKKAGIRVKSDLSDKSAGWKFSEYEMKGVPVRLEIGPKDIEKNQCVLSRRDTGEKISVSLDTFEDDLKKLLDDIQNNLFEKAKQNRDSKTYTAKNMEEFEKIINKTPGFIKAMWCGDQACEDKIKELTAATSRCIPFEQEEISDTCVCCGKKAKYMVIWGRAY
jgi:prolyl-tRNA synthetase